MGGSKVSLLFSAAPERRCDSPRRRGAAAGVRRALGLARGARGARRGGAGRVVYRRRVCGRPRAWRVELLAEQPVQRDASLRRRAQMCRVIAPPGPSRLVCRYASLRRPLANAQHRNQIHKPPGCHQHGHHPSCLLKRIARRVGAEGANDLKGTTPKLAKCGRPAPWRRRRGKAGWPCLLYLSELVDLLRVGGGCPRAFCFPVSMDRIFLAVPSPVLPNPRARPRGSDFVAELRLCSAVRLAHSEAMDDS